MTGRPFALACRIGACFLDINQMLACEQIAMMRSAAATTTHGRATQDELTRLHGIELREHGFPHRPYRRRHS